MRTVRKGPSIAVLVASVMTVAVWATPANAAVGSLSAWLNIGPPDRAAGRPAYTPVTVWGRVPMTQAEAQGLINSRHRVLVRVWGEDPVSDDLMLGPYYLAARNPAAIQTGYITATPQGLRFYSRIVVNPTRLNEDCDPGPGGHGDELYAGVRLINASGATIRSDETNRWTGYCSHVPCGPTYDGFC